MICIINNILMVGIKSCQELDGQMIAKYDVGISECFTEILHGNVVCSVERTIDGGSSAIVQVHVLDCVDEVGAVFKFLVEVVSGKLNSHPFSLLKVRKLKWSRGE